MQFQFKKIRKKQLKTLAWEWQCHPANAGQVLTKYSIVGLLHRATEICLTKPDLIPNGFRRSGICPFNPSAPNKDKLLPATIFEVSPENPSPLVDKPSIDSPSPLVDTHSTDIPSPLADAPSTDIPTSLVDNSCSNLYTEVEKDRSTSHGSVNTVMLPASPLQVDVDSERMTDSPDPDIVETQKNESFSFQWTLSFDTQDSTQPDAVNTFTMTSDDSHDDLTSFEMPSPATHTNVQMPSSSHLTSTPIEAVKKTYWSGQTKLCPTCSKIIPLSVFSIHARTCSHKIEVSPATIAPASAPETPPHKLDTVPKFTLDERLIQLNKFEVLMLNPAQVKEFNENLQKKQVVHDEPLFNRWLNQNH